MVQSVKLTWNSDTDCPSGESGEKYMLSVAIDCDKDLKKPGELFIQDLRKERTCNPLIITSHSASCPRLLINDWSWFNFWKPAPIASMFIIVGLGFALVGKSNFSIMQSISISMNLILGIMYISIDYGINESIFGFLTTLLVAGLLFVLMTVYLRKKCIFPFTIVFLGANLGFFQGGYIFTMIYLVGGTSSLALCLSIVCVMTLIFAVITFCFRYSMLYLTFLVAAIGSTFIMRGIAIWQKGYPVDSIQWVCLQQGLDLHVDNTVFAYFFCQAPLFLLLLCWQATFSIYNTDLELVEYLEAGHKRMNLQYARKYAKRH